MTYSSELEWLASLEKFGIRPGLETVTELLLALKNPQNRFSSILVTGTNGKGSVAAMLQAILTLSGYRVGLYTSPHLVNVEERIRIGFEDISSQILSRSLEKVRVTIEDLMKQKRIDRHPTYFEVLTAAAFNALEAQKIKIAVLEIGMGGRYDAANTVLPVLSIITNIEKDHTEYLGTTLEKIAREKAGIVKEHGTVVTGEMKTTPLRVIKTVCREHNAYLIHALKESECSINRNGAVSIRTAANEYKKMKIGLTGWHQIENACIAVRAAELLADKGFTIPKEKIIEGIEKVHWKGRLERIDSDPPILLDGAHNVAAIRALSTFLLTLKEKGKQLKIIFGAMRDKDVDGMMKILFPIADSIYLTAPDMERALHPDDLYKKATKYNRNVRTFASLHEALAAARQVQSSNVISIRTRRPLSRSVICICGSLFLVGAFKALQMKDPLLR